MNGEMDKSLLFMTLSFLCIWIIVDVAIGKNYLGTFLSSIFPFMGNDEKLSTDGNKLSTDTEDTEETEKKTYTNSSGSTRPKSEDSSQNKSTKQALPYGRNYGQITIPDISGGTGND